MGVVKGDLEACHGKCSVHELWIQMTNRWTILSSSHGESGRSTSDCSHLLMWMLERARVRKCCMCWQKVKGKTRDHTSKMKESCISFQSSRSVANASGAPLKTASSNLYRSSCRSSSGGGNFAKSGILCRSRGIFPHHLEIWGFIASFIPLSMIWNHLNLVNFSPLISHQQRNSHRM